MVHFGPGPTVAVSLAIGMLSYPLIKKVTLAALEALGNLLQAINESAFIVRVKSMNCTLCADQHREHITTWGIS